VAWLKGGPQRLHEAYRRLSRVSTEEQARIQDGSLVSQNSRITEYVEAQNKTRKDFGTLVDFYSDDGKSAKSIKGRPEFQRMLSDVEKGKVDLIISTELSRLSQSIRDGAY
jgi:site-specific DNA recombinase